MCDEKALAFSKPVSERSKRWARSQLHGALKRAVADPRGRGQYRFAAERVKMRLKAVLRSRCYSSMGGSANKGG